MKNPQSRKRLTHLVAAALGCGLLIGLFSLLARKGWGIPCLFLQFTGLQCPGCGNSRAALALLRLDLAGALEYNLLFPVEFFYLAWVILHSCRAYLKTGRAHYEPPCRWLDAAVLVVILLWWVIRNLI